jgi:hypothetical protein
VPGAVRTGAARRLALIVPLVLVNTTAVYGQAAWAWDHLVPAGLRTGAPAAAVALCLLFAATVESVGIYLAYEAHAALMEDQAAGMLRSGSYLVALVVGSLNYAHFATQPGYRPNPLAVTFGLLSSLSPWLWAIRSRSLHRSALLAKGLVDPRSVRFTTAQRLLYPLRSYGAYRLAVWNGVNNPAAARADYDAFRAARRGRGEIASPIETTELPATTDTEVRPAPEPEVSPTPAPEVRPNPGVEVSSGAAVADAEVSAPTLARTSVAKSRTSTRSSVPGKGGSSTRGKGATSARRSTEETRELAAQLRGKHPEINNTELARLLGISTTRLRQVETEVRQVNGTKVPPT